MSAGRLSSAIAALLLAASTVPSPAATLTPAPADCGAELARFEGAVRAAPDDLLLGSDYRHAVIACGAHDRALAFFAELGAAHPRSASVLLNHGYAYVDKLPTAGAVHRVLLANAALGLFSRAVEVEPSWLALFTRGNSYLYWPPSFGRAALAVADLGRAAAIARRSPLPHQRRGWIALGDAHWKVGELDKARTAWNEGLRLFPGEARLAARLASRGDELAALIEADLDPRQRVDTDLSSLAPAAIAAAVPEPASTPPGALRFVEVGAVAGARIRHHARIFTGPYADTLGMFTAGGAAVAVGDYDGDGRDDLFLTDSDLGRGNHLLHNDGPGADGVPRFRDVTVEAGVGAGNDARSIVADALWFDADDDGRQDLLVARFGAPLLYRNLGGGRFVDATVGSGLDAFANTIAAVAFDYDRDGRLDLLFGNYFEPKNLLDLPDRHVLPEDLDDANNGGGVTLWRNLGARPARGEGWVRFADVTKAAGLAAHTGWTLDVGHADLDGDGWQDVYLACDYGTDRLFWNQRDGTFVDGTVAALGGLDTKKGMNVDVADYDRDGWLDVYVTNITDDYMKECNMLWRGEGVAPAASAAGSAAAAAPPRPTFTDVSKETGTCNTLWGWGAKWGDFDDDGWPDLFVANGLRSAGREDYVPVLVEAIVQPGFDFSDAAAYPPIGDRSWSGYQKKKLFRNLGGSTFAEVAASAGVDNDRDGRGIALADFDGDGRLDVFQTNAAQESLLYLNRTTGAGHWLGLRLVGTKGNGDAIGARVTVTAGGARQVHELDGGNGYAAQSSKVLHFGLGAAAKVDAVEIRWPNGAVETVAVPVDRVSTVREGSGVQR